MCLELNDDLLKKIVISSSIFAEKSDNVSQFNYPLNANVKEGFQKSIAMAEHRAFRENCCNHCCCQTYELASPPNPTTRKEEMHLKCCTQHHPFHHASPKPNITTLDL